MGSHNRNRLNSAKDAKKYHCLKLVEGLLKGDEQLAEKHLVKMVTTRLTNKVKHIMNHDKLI